MDTQSLGDVRAQPPIKWLGRAAAGAACWGVLSLLCWDAYGKGRELKRQDDEFHKRRSAYELAISTCPQIYLLGKGAPVSAIVADSGRKAYSLDGNAYLAAVVRQNPRMLSRQPLLADTHRAVLEGPLHYDTFAPDRIGLRFGAYRVPGACAQSILHEGE